MQQERQEPHHEIHDSWLLLQQEQDLKLVSGLSNIPYTAVYFIDGGTMVLFK